MTTKWPSYDLKWAYMKIVIYFKQMLEIFSLFFFFDFPKCLIFCHCFFDISIFWFSDFLQIFRFWNVFFRIYFEVFNIFLLSLNEMIWNTFLQNFWIFFTEILHFYYWFCDGQQRTDKQTTPKKATLNPYYMKKWENDTWYTKRIHTHISFF